jgi:hypothetical protein
MFTITLALKIMLSSGVGGSDGDSSGFKQQEYTKQQKANRADVIKALTDQTNINTRDR